MITRVHWRRVSCNGGWDPAHLELSTYRGITQDAGVNRPSVSVTQVSRPPVSLSPNAPDHGTSDTISSWI